jgi:hypothetical protein
LTIRTANAIERLNNVRPSHVMWFEKWWVSREVKFMRLESLTIRTANAVSN